ncbi:MAG: acyl-CoA dehydratase activase [Planctomycetota bacterium]|nr:acyl-CoA dehydratase activase [Planctomycetota bacterium]
MNVPFSREERMYFAGIDAGSRTVKVAIIEAESRKVVGQGLLDQGVDHDGRATRLFDDVLKAQGLRRQDIVRVVATGYTRHGISLADTTITEITCHAAGVRQVLPEARTVVEIGGQDSKLLWLAEDGGVRDFAMNDRCAAGTGRFLEVVASRLETSLAGLGAQACLSRRPAAISSMCVVFAETEIIGLLSSGVPREDIVAGVQAAIASRIAAMAGRRITLPVVFTGGVALVSGMAAALQTALECPIVVAPDPQMTGALGAAILAARGR